MLAVVRALSKVGSGGGVDIDGCWKGEEGGMEMYAGIYVCMDGWMHGRRDGDVCACLLGRPRHRRTLY